MPYRNRESSVRGCKIALVSVFAITVVLLSLGVAVWIVTDENASRTRKLQDYRLCNACFSSPDETRGSDLKCDESTKRKCGSAGWKRNEKLPSSFTKDQNAQQYIKENVNSHFDDAKQKFAAKNLREKENGILTKAEKLFYAADNEPIIHWSPDVTSSPIPDKHGWQTLKAFWHDQSYFTISSGPVNAYRDGGVHVTKRGFYFIYAKLTFACQTADGKEKKVSMDVAISKASQQKHLLRDEQTATCRLPGDLVTLYQSGIFELGEGDDIILKYQAPDDVALSKRKGFFKSTIGLVGLGSARTHITA